MLLQLTGCGAEVTGDNMIWYPCDTKHVVKVPEGNQLTVLAVTLPLWIGMATLSKKKKLV